MRGTIASLVMAAVVLLILPGCGISAQGVVGSKEHHETAPIKAGPFISPLSRMVFPFEERYQVSISDTLTPVGRVSKTAQIEKKDGTRTEDTLLPNAVEVALAPNGESEAYLPFVIVASELGVPRSNMVSDGENLRIYLKPGMYGDIRPGSKSVCWSDGEVDTLGKAPRFENGQLEMDIGDIAYLLSSESNRTRKAKHPLVEDRVEGEASTDECSLVGAFFRVHAR